MAAKLVVFDIDGTLTTGPSLERRFARMLWRKGFIGRAQIAAFVRYLLRSWPTRRSAVFRNNKSYLFGLSVACVREEADAFVRTQVMASLRPECLARLYHHQQAEDTVLLLSGTLQAIADSLARQLGVDSVIATLPEIDGTGYGQRSPERHPYGGEKRRLLQQWCKATSASYESVVAYADSIHDLALLEQVGQPVCVYPDRALRAIAVERGYEILDG